jgi:chitodextrinase
MLLLSDHVHVYISLLPPYSVAPSARPSDLIVTGSDSSSVSLSWNPPPAKDHNGQLTGYIVKYVTSADAQSSKATGDTSIKIDGLKSNTEYTFQVSAKNAAGTGPFTSKSQRTAQIGKVA